MSRPNHTYNQGIVHLRTLMDAVEADTTSVDIPIAGAKAVGFQFTEGGTVNNRQADFTVDVSFDNGDTYTDYNLLIDNVTNDNVQDLTRVGTKNRSSAGTDILWMTPETLGAITHIKVDLDVTDGADPTGTFTVKANIAY